MCGIVGAISKTPVNQLLYDALLLVQHRGQDAAGIVTSDGPRLHMHRCFAFVTTSAPFAPRTRMMSSAMSLVIVS